MAVRDGNGAPLVIFPFRNRVVYIRDDEEAGMLPAEIVAHYYWSYPEVTRQAMPEVLRTAAWALLVDWNNNGHPLED